METEDLKNRWSSLEEQLKKQEVFNEHITKELLHTKCDKALSRLINYGIFELIVLLAAIPAVIYILGVKKNIPDEYYIFTYCLTGLCVLTLFWQIWKIYDLMQIDFSKTLSNNFRYTNKYNIKIRREKIATLFFVPALALFMIYFYAKLHAPVLLWAIMACVFICLIVYSYWAFKRFYEKNITSILKSLEELKELEE
jgi:hypothetical protein